MICVPGASSRCTTPEPDLTAGSRSSSNTAAKNSTKSSSALTSPTSTRCKIAVATLGDQDGAAGVTRCDDDRSRRTEGQRGNRREHAPGFRFVHPDLTPLPPWRPGGFRVHGVCARFHERGQQFVPVLVVGVHGKRHLRQADGQRGAARRAHEHGHTSSPALHPGLSRLGDRDPTPFCPRPITGDGSHREQGQRPGGTRSARLGAVRVSVPYAVGASSAMARGRVDPPSASGTGRTRRGRRGRTSCRASQRAARPG